MPPDERANHQPDPEGFQNAAIERALATPRDLLSDLRSIFERSHASTTIQQPENLPSGFARADDVIILLQPVRLDAPSPLEELRESLWADLVLSRHTKNAKRVTPTAPDALEDLLLKLAGKNFLTGSQRLQRGGLGAALLHAASAKSLGFHIDLSENEGTNPLHALFNERPGRVLATARAKAHLPLENFAERTGSWTADAIGRVTPGDIRVRWLNETVLETNITALTTKQKS
jgi:phosphoribosylformylglycinamidine (FGAM) synthase-like enzyme